jgi:uracil-DNA glycosylase family 4
MPKDLIVGKGPQNAKIMFVGDTPSEADEKAGFAFAGSEAGTIISLCNENGIKFEECYRTLLFKERLSYNGKGKKKLTEAIGNAQRNRNYDEILLSEIQTLGPRVVVPLGELAFRYVSGEKSITKFRGSVLPLRGDLQAKTKNIVRVIPTLGPKYIYENYTHRVYVSVDYGKIAQHQNQIGEIKTEGLVWIADTAEKFRVYLQRYPNPTFGVFDIETRWNIPVCIGFCFSPSEAICVPLLDSTLDMANQILLWQMVDRVLRTNKHWCNQNIKFDIMVLQRFGFEIKEESVLADTALRSSIIYPELPKNLGFLNSIYTDMPYFKDEGKDPSDRSKLYLYCAKDCLSTYQIKVKQDLELEELGIANFERQIHTLFWPYVHIEERGLLIDEERKFSLLGKYNAVQDTLTYTLNKLCNKELNPRSPKQVGIFLYDELKFPARHDRATGNYATDEDTLEELRIFHLTDNKLEELGGKILEIILGLRKLHKVIEYLESPIHPDSRMRCSYDLGGTRTGRSAGKATTDYLLTKDDKGRFVISDCGRSLQTIGKHGFKIGNEWYGRDLRSIFVPTPGYIFVEGDLSQAEARVDAVLAEDYNILALFDIKPGIHVKTGEWVFGRIIDKKQEPDKYHIAKTVRHAGERNMGPDRLSAMIQEPLPFCKDILNTFHSFQPNIRNVFHYQIREFVKQNKFLVSPHGRRRDFFGKVDNSLYNDAISQIPQATVSDQLKLSLPILIERFKEHEVFFCYEGHDALMAEIRKDFLESYCDSFHEVVERPIDFRNCSLKRNFDLVIPAELSWSEATWQEMKDV